MTENLPKILTIKEHETPEDLQAMRQFMAPLTDQITGPMTEAEYEHLYGFKPVVQTPAKKQVNPDPSDVWDEPTPIQEGSHLPPDKDFDEIADMGGLA